MKYYVYKFNTKSGFKFKRTKCSDYWSNDYNICWQFTKQGAKGIIDFLNERRKNDLYVYGMIEVDKAEQMLNEYIKHEDMQTYIAEMQNYRWEP